MGYARREVDRRWREGVVGWDRDPEVPEAAYITVSSMHFDTVHRQAFEGSSGVVAVYLRTETRSRLSEPLPSAIGPPHQPDQDAKVPHSETSYNPSARAANAASWTATP